MMRDLIFSSRADNGTLEFQATPGGAALATCGFQADAFPTISAGGGVITANQPMTPESNASAGTVAWAQWRSSGGTVIVQCDVTQTGGGGDIIISSTTLQAGDSVDCTALTYAAPV